MARDTLAVTTLDREGIAPDNWTLGVAANDLSIASGWDDRLFVEIENVSAASKTVTVETYLTNDGFAIADMDCVVPAPVLASLTTAHAGANNDIVFTARRPGEDGNRIKVVFAVAGLNTALSVSVAGCIITINVATDGAGAATSTADDVKAAIEASAAADALVSVADAAANDGSGIVAAMASTALSGGIEGKLIIGPFTRLETFQQSDGTLYIDLADDNALYFRAYTLP